MTSSARPPGEEDDPGEERFEPALEAIVRDPSEERAADTAASPPASPAPPPPPPVAAGEASPPPPRLLTKPTGPLSKPRMTQPVGSLPLAGARPVVSQRIPNAPDARPQVRGPGLTKVDRATRPVTVPPRVLPPRPARDVGASRPLIRPGSKGPEPRVPEAPTAQPILPDRRDDPRATEPESPRAPTDPSLASAPAFESTLKGFSRRDLELLATKRVPWHGVEPQRPAVAGPDIDEMDLGPTISDDVAPSARVPTRDLAPATPAPPEVAPPAPERTAASPSAALGAPPAPPALGALPAPPALGALPAPPAPAPPAPTPPPPPPAFPPLDAPRAIPADLRDAPIVVRDPTRAVTVTRTVQRALGTSAFPKVSIVTLILLFQAVALPSAAGPPWELLARPAEVTLQAFAAFMLVGVVHLLPFAERTRARLGVALGLALMPFVVLAWRFALTAGTFDVQPALVHLFGVPGLDPAVAPSSGVGAIAALAALVLVPAGLFARAPTLEGAPRWLAWVLGGLGLGAAALALATAPVGELFGALIDSAFLGDRVAAFATLPLFTALVFALATLVVPALAPSGPLAAVLVWATALLPLVVLALFAAKSDQWMEIIEPLKLVSFLAAMTLYLAAALGGPALRPRA